MDLLLTRADFLSAGALGESNRLHAAGCIVLNSVVAEKADPMGEFSRSFLFLSLASPWVLLAVWWERYHQGTSRAVFTFLSPIERILVASRAVWFYLSKIIWPSNLTFIYPRWDISPTDLLNYVWLLAGVTACGALYFLRRYLGAASRSQRHFSLRRLARCWDSSCFTHFATRL